MRSGNGMRGGNCVAYVRGVTGIQLDGNAALWWPHAAGRYERGQEPKLGAVLVFKSSGYMRSGHVAVVSKVVGAREILVDHANWVRGRVTKAMSVIDTSPGNDWTSVKVQLVPNTTAGRDNPTFGFIYPRSLPADFGTEIAESPATPHGRAHDAHATRHDRKLATLERSDATAAELKSPHNTKHAKHHPVEDAKLAYVY